MRSLLHPDAVPVVEDAAALPLVKPEVEISGHDRLRETLSSGQNAQDQVLFVGAVHLEQVRSGKVATPARSRGLCCKLEKFTQRLRRQLKNLF